MDDLISRRMAIDALAEYMPTLTTADGSALVDHDIFVAQETYVDCIQIIHELPSAQPEESWIPCSFKMPEEHEWIGTYKFGTTISDEVYVTFVSPNGERFCKHVSFQNGKLSRHDQDLINVWFKGATPIAWRKLPEPYQEEQDG